MNTFSSAPGEREDAEEVEDIWQQLVRAYLKLSPHGQWIVAPESGHYIHLDEPDLVIREVLGLVDSVRQARTEQCPPRA